MLIEDLFLYSQDHSEFVYYLHHKHLIPEIHLTATKINFTSNFRTYWAICQITRYIEKPFYEPYQYYFHKFLLAAERNKH